MIKKIKKGRKRNISFLKILKTFTHFEARIKNVMGPA